MPQQIAITSFYHFASREAGQLAALADTVREIAGSSALRGLVVLAPEGVNATVSGSNVAVAQFKELMAAAYPGSTLLWKDSEASREVFRRFKVDIRPEIVTIGDSSIDPKEAEGSVLSPEEWEQMLETDPNIVLLDTRNRYETSLGAFRSAVDPGLSSFSEFIPYVQGTPFPKDTKVLMYCTGGVRCEKAAVVMKRAGYQQVFQLGGGILKYLERFPHRRFEGECYVFDHRVAVDQELKPSARYGLCPHCGDPSSVAVVCAECGAGAKLCPACSTTLPQPACSKNCVYHLDRRRARSQGASTPGNV